VVFGRTASRVNEAQALDYVLGYAVAIDVAIPHKSVFRPAIRQRCSDGFLPIGPGVVERSAVADPDKLTITVSVNGAEKQRWSTAELVRPVAKLIAEISDFMTFAEGDALLVGLPASNPLARVGDKVSAAIDGLGRLDAVLAAETPVQWQA
jgi:5-oxopent-3-ene-1,2,5-tricarboxylate decarboxylase / 2-hydroxyhepta-2,4-diene-1,7-dioate isomerase